MSIYDTLNPQQKEAVLHTEGPDSQDRLSDRGKGSESVEYHGNHLYQQGSRRDA